MKAKWIFAAFRISKLVLLATNAVEDFHIENCDKKYPMLIVIQRHLRRQCNTR
jgi:hypothetical protein